MNGSPIAAIIRGWVDLYTRGMPAEMRAARRDEVDDDLWCQHEEAVVLGRSARSLGTDLILRLLFGVPADLSWRLSYRGKTVGTSMERTSSMNTRDLGVCAIVAGLSFGILMILFIPIGEALWMGDYGLFGNLVSLVGAIAFVAAALGLAWRFHDRIGPLGGFGAIVTTLGAILSLGMSVVPLLVGSAMLMWDLARIGVVSWVIPIVQLASAIVLTVGLVVWQPGIGDTGNRALFVALFTPYLVTWVVIGVSLSRGVPQAQATSG
jgi:hypothetical protein